MTAWLVGAVAGLAVALALAPTPRAPHRAPAPEAGDPDWVRRGRWVWAASAGLACWTFRPGWTGLVLGAVAAGFVHRLASTAEPASGRRAREALRADLPILVLLLAASLRAGATPGVGVRRACAALPGPATDRLAPVTDRLALGVDPVSVWEEVARDPDLAMLGRAMSRAQRSGASVATGVERLAEELAASGRAETEDRARAVGVKAAVPLGLCLLPSFLLLGIVPMVASLVAGLRL
ncbi:type II secretion system F family protein [Nocardioides euryhalodurans]|uniref:Type II secretion system protein n=1 Tax=Nocardioides euryhalodurans TaxID=2518370 RepID=A0A4P7GLL7_9ACTN|nr:type II secretion system F family protein [Nocardioides euryhalodurans]QBR92611.1 type II secretion system protein [Nocardioides euryhalodurans]